MPPRQPAPHRPLAANDTDVVRDGRRSYYETLIVARAHGTLIASQWSGHSRHVVVRLRKDHDGYTRGRGHPSRAELDAMAPRRDCECPRCVDHWDIVDRAAQRRALERHTLRARQVAEHDPDDWRAQALCLALPTAVWFPTDDRGQQPGEANRHRYQPAKDICAACPVRTDCLEQAMAAGDLADGVFGGLDPIERRELHRQRRRRAG